MNTAIDADNRFPDKLIYMKFDLDDTPEENIERYFDKGRQFIEEAKKNKGRIIGWYCILFIMIRQPSEACVTTLYEGVFVCPSVPPSIHLSIRLSVRSSVGPSVGPEKRIICI